MQFHEVIFTLYSVYYHLEKQIVQKGTWYLHASQNEKKKLIHKRKLYY